MNLRRIAAIARSQVVELSRRRLAIALLIALPLVFYWTSADDEFAILFATIGVGWSIAIVSLFLSHSMNDITPRLALIGFRPVEIVIGRVLAVLTFGLAVAVGLWLYLRIDPVIVDDRQLAVALLMTVTASGVTGLAAGALINREMEAMLFLIGVVALILVVDTRSSLAKVLPLYGTYRYSNGSIYGQILPDDGPWRWWLGYCLVVAVIAVIATMRRVPTVGTGPLTEVPTGSGS